MLFVSDAGTSINSVTQATTGNFQECIGDIAQARAQTFSDPTGSETAVFLYFMHVSCLLFTDDADRSLPCAPQRRPHVLRYGRWQFSCALLMSSIEFMQEVFYRPVALKCGHVFCRTCACRAAHVHPKNPMGLAGALKTEHCPMCREVSRCLDRLVQQSHLQGRVNSVRFVPRLVQVLIQGFLDILRKMSASAKG
jgi:hypothetical protein